MYEFLRIIRTSIKNMSKQELNNFIMQNSFNTTEKQILKLISLGYSTETIMWMTHTTRNELYKHYKLISKQLG